MSVSRRNNFTFRFESITRNIGSDQCIPKVQCSSASKYRTIDGSCNNLNNPQWGAAGTSYGRLIPPKYSDGIHAPAVSVVGGEPLPSARELSRKFFPAAPIDDPRWTLLAMEWGQLVALDMSEAMNGKPNPNYAECCDPIQGPLFGKLSKGEPCFPITIADDDAIFLKYKQKCMDFLRTTTDMQKGCPSTEYAQALSENTHLLDGSPIYGSDEKTHRSLRAGEGGRLKVEVRHGQVWPPTDYNNTVLCRGSPQEQACYKFGHAVGNRDPQLTSLLIILLREHNRIADELNIINPHWNDETIFQEARKIVIAVIQHITYYHWLHMLIGKTAVATEGFNYKADGDYYVNDYNDSVNPSVVTEHAQGAFKFFHSLIQGQLHFMSKDRISLGHIRLIDHVSNPSILEEPGMFDALNIGLVTQRAHSCYHFHTDDIKENLYRIPEDPTFGFDLKSIDIQRGRDHGLASYNQYRQFCGYKKATSFDDFNDLISDEHILVLQQAYRHPDDVDLSVGGSLEHWTPEVGPGVGYGPGPVFQCLLKHQFLLSRIGDRFFYELPGIFTLKQLTELRKSNIARMFCDNSDIQIIQPKPLEKITESNSLVSCLDYEAIPKIDLQLWKEYGNGLVV